MGAKKTKTSAPGRELVSIVSISYNQEKFIAQALEGFIAQQHPDFDIEIIVADDASSDGTQKIIRDLQSQHPELIHALLREKNVGVRDNLSDALCHAKGDYIALCEGDDYWTDDTKLQQQVSYMRAHTAATTCFHLVRVAYEGDKTREEVFPDTEKGRVFTLQDLIRSNFIQTNSVMYRRLSSYEEVIPRDILPLDWYLHILHAAMSPGEPIGFIDSPMAVYRRHAQGIWQRNKENEHAFWLKMSHPHMRMHEEIIRLFKDDPALQLLAWEAALTTTSEVYAVLADHEDYGKAGELMEEFPAYTAKIIADQKKRLEEKTHRLDDANNKLYQLGVDTAIMQETITTLKAQNEHVYRLLARTFEHRLIQGVRFIQRRLQRKP